jgi:hypothetical protein
MKATLTFELIKFKSETQPTSVEWDTTKDHGPPIPEIGDVFFKSSTMRGTVKTRSFSVISGEGSPPEISIWLEVE